MEGLTLDERLKAEEQELKNNIENLQGLIENKSCSDALSTQDHALIIAQLDAMRNYRNILAERIKLIQEA